MDSVRVLIANGSPAYLEVTKRMLEYQDGAYSVDGVLSGTECLERIGTGEYDVVLIDSKLVDSSGIDLVRKLNHQAVTIPLILTIEETEKDQVVDIEVLGLFECIAKKKGYLSSLPALISRAAEAKRRMDQSKRETESRGPQTPMPESEPSLKTGGEATATKSTPFLGEGYFILDRRSKFLSANSNMELITGYSEEELLELQFTDLFVPEEEKAFFDWADSCDEDETIEPLRIKITTKTGQKQDLDLYASVVRSDDGEIVGYRGRAIQVIGLTRRMSPLGNGKIDQARLINEMVDAIQYSYFDSLSGLLKRIAEIICQVFGFNRSTIALLDKRKKAFIKQAMVGYLDSSSHSIEKRAIEVPEDVISRIFADRFKIKVIYYSQDARGTRDNLSPGIPERRTHSRRPHNQWHKRDLIMINLTDDSGKSFGYISLDDPLEGNVPTRNTFSNLEIFGKLASFAVENYYRFSATERRHRRLKQVLVTSNIFKLYLSLSELLKEIVWSVKFSLDFSLVTLVLISKKTGMLETKAVACEDKIKMLQLRELKFGLKEFGELLKEEYRRGKSYLIDREEPVLKPLKRIYYGAQMNGRFNNGWPYWGLLLVPLKSREGKIIGFLMADDPMDCRLPSADLIHTLEILANQIAVAIDNRILYVQAKEQQRPEPARQESHPDIFHDEYSSGGLKKLVEKFLR